MTNVNQYSPVSQQRHLSQWTKSIFLAREGQGDRVGLGLGLGWNRIEGVNYDTGSDPVSFRPGFVRQMK